MIPDGSTHEVCTRKKLEKECEHFKKQNACRNGCFVFRNARPSWTKGYSDKCALQLTKRILQHLYVVEEANCRCEVPPQQV